MILFINNITYKFHYFKVIQPKKVTLKRTSVTVLNGDDIKPQEEKEIEESEDLESKDRVIKLDDVETMSQTEVKSQISTLYRK